MATPVLYESCHCLFPTILVVMLRYPLWWRYYSDLPTIHL